MTSENKTWKNVKAEYLRKVEKALSSAKSPRSSEILEDVSVHLDRRFAELGADRQTWENFQAIITEMGPASDYAELLNSGAASPSGNVRRKYFLWIGIAVAVVIIPIALLLSPLFLFPVKVVTQRDLDNQGQPSLINKDADKLEAENLAGQAWQLWRQRKLPEAEELFQKAVSKDAKNADAWNGLGWSQFNQGKSLNAKGSFEKCLEIQPKHAAALNGLGWIAKSQGKTDEAMDYWQEAVEAAPNATAALSGLATTSMELKKYDLAVKYYQMWLTAEPNNAKVKADLEKARSAMSAVEPNKPQHLSY